MTTRHVQRSPAGHRLLAESADAGDIVRLEGEYWTIVYAGTVCRLRDAKGLHYLAHLLRHPGQTFPAVGLAAACLCGTRHTECGLDSTGNAIRGPKSATEERARLAVTKRIKAAIKKIEQHHAALGQHLIASMRTGYYCAYLPDPHDPISWSV